MRRVACWRWPSPGWWSGLRCSGCWWPCWDPTPWPSGCWRCCRGWAPPSPGAPPAGPANPPPQAEAAAAQLAPNDHPAAPPERRSRPRRSPASASTSALCSPMRGGWRVRPRRARGRRRIPPAGPAGRPCARAAERRDRASQQPAGGQQMRVVEQVGRLADRRPGDAGALAARARPRPAACVPITSCSAGISQDRSLAALSIGRQARIGRQFPQAELLDEARPLLVAGDADEQLPAVRGGEHLVDRPRRRAAPASAAAATPVAAMPAMWVPIRKTALSNSALQTRWPLPGRVALAQRRLHRDHAEHRAEDVDDRGAGAQRPARRAGHVGEAGLELHHLVQRRAVLVGAGEVALQRQVDQPRVDRRAAAPSRSPAAPSCRGRNSPAPHRPSRDQPVHRRLALRPLQVERQAALVAVEGGEEPGGEAAAAGGCGRRPAPAPPSPHRRRDRPAPARRWAP